MSSTKCKICICFKSKGKVGCVGCPSCGDCEGQQPLEYCPCTEHLDLEALIE